MKTNCRNCKWAEWSKSETGRRQYGNAAYCTYPVSVKLPASRYRIVDELKRKVGVREYRDIQLVCDTWDRVPNVELRGCALLRSPT